MHTAREKKKLISRIRRIRGQLEAVETALSEEKGCYEILQTVRACRTCALCRRWTTAPCS